MERPPDAHHAGLASGHQGEPNIAPTPDTTVIRALNLQIEAAVAGQDHVGVEEIYVAGKGIDAFLDLLERREAALSDDRVAALLRVEGIVIVRRIGRCGEGNVRPSGSEGYRQPVRGPIPFHARRSTDESPNISSQGVLGAYSRLNLSTVGVFSPKLSGG